MKNEMGRGTLKDRDKDQKSETTISCLVDQVTDSICDVSPYLTFVREKKGTTFEGVRKVQ